MGGNEKKKKLFVTPHTFKYIIDVIVSKFRSDLLIKSSIVNQSSLDLYKTEFDSINVKVYFCLKDSLWKLKLKGLIIIFEYIYH